MLVNLEEVARKRALQAYCRPCRWRDIMTESPPALLPFHDLFREAFPSRLLDRVQRAVPAEAAVPSLGELVAAHERAALGLVAEAAAARRAQEPQPVYLEVEEAQIVAEFELVDRRRAPREPLVDWSQVNFAEAWRHFASGAYLEILIRPPRTLWQRAVDWVVSQVLAPAVNPASIL